MKVQFYFDTIQLLEIFYPAFILASLLIFFQRRHRILIKILNEACILLFFIHGFVDLTVMLAPDGFEDNYEYCSEK